MPVAAASCDERVGDLRSGRACSRRCCARAAASGGRCWGPPRAGRPAAPTGPRRGSAARRRRSRRPSTRATSSCGVVRATWPATAARSRVRTRVASRRLVGVAEGRVGDRDARLRAQSPRRTPPGPTSRSSWRVPSGARRARSSVGQLAGGVDRDRRRSVRLVDRDVGEVAAAAGCRGRPRLRAVSSCGCVSMNEVVTPPGAKSGSSSTAWRKGMLVETPRIRNSASARRAFSTAELEGAAAAGELGQHRVEVGADLGAGVGRAAVEADAGTAGGAVGRDLAGVGPEAVGRVLGGDPALQRGAAQLDAVLGEAEVGEGLARRRSASATARGRRR